MEAIDLELYKQNYNYGYLVGLLETMARFNSKRDHGYSFNLNRYIKRENLKVSIEPSFKSFCEDYKLIKIENPKNALLKIIRDDWFFVYQDERHYHLIDKGNNFSLFDSETKTEFVEEFLNLLFDTLKPIGVYKVEMIGQVGYYANMWENVAFETYENNSWDYMLNFELKD
jgi:hypothetical protein